MGTIEAIFHTSEKYWSLRRLKSVVRYMSALRGRCLSEVRDLIYSRRFPVFEAFNEFVYFISFDGDVLMRVIVRTV